MARFENVTLQSPGEFGYSANERNFISSFQLFLIREAWDRGADFEDLADGYGPGMGTQGDWSGIRDSSPEAQEQMLERALNHLFG